MCTSFLAFGCFRGHSFCMVPSKVGKGYCPLRWSLRQDHLRSLRFCYLVCMTTLDVSGCFVKLMSLLWGTLSDSEERADLQRCSSGCCLTVFSWTRLSFRSDQGREQLQGISLQIHFAGCWFLIMREHKTIWQEMFSFHSHFVSQPMA